MTEPTAKHREEARELVLRILRLRQSTELGGQYAGLVDAIATVLSSRDREIREVLEGLRYSEVGWCWCKGPGHHTPACLAARGLWERVQVNVKKEESDVVK